MAELVEVQIYSGSKEMLRFAVAANRDEVHTGIPSAGFSNSEDVEPTSYTTSAWYSSEQTVEEINGQFLRAFVAQLLVSGVGHGGDVELADGEHFMFSKVTMPDGQAPVKLAGKVTVL